MCVLTESCCRRIAKKGVEVQSRKKLTNLIKCLLWVFFVSLYFLFWFANGISHGLRLIIRSGWSFQVDAFADLNMIRLWLDNQSNRLKREKEAINKFICNGNLWNEHTMSERKSSILWNLSSEIAPMRENGPIGRWWHYQKTSTVSLNETIWNGFVRFFIALITVVSWHGCESGC